MYIFLVMKKILFFFFIFSFFATSSIAYWASIDQVSQNIDTSSKLFWLVSPDTVISIITKLILVVVTIIWTWIAKKVSSDRLIGYLETKFEWKWWGEEVIWVVTRSVNITILIIWFSIVLWIMWVDLWIFMWWIWFGIGFTLKTFLTNFTAWIIMVTQWVYHNWDLIEVWGEMWKIVKINSLFTAVEKLDWIIFYIPNISFLEEKVSNYHSNDKRRIEIETLVDYNTDTTKTKAVINKVLENFPVILKEPWSQIIIDKLDDSWILIIIRCWIRSKENYIETKSNITETINLAFKQSQIDIPYPHMEIIQRK